MQTTRRNALKIFGLGGAVVFAAPSLLAAAAQTAPTSNDLFKGKLGPFIKINPDNSIIIGAPIADMGTGVETSVPMMAAEELDADWALVTVHRMAYGAVKTDDGKDYELYATQGSGGSGSMRRSWQVMRECGAIARQMLLKAAAQSLGVPQTSLRTKASHIIAGPNTYPYAQFAEAALNTPIEGMYLEDFTVGSDDFIRKVSIKDQDIALKKPSAFTIIGKGKVQKNAHAIATGTEIFGVDMDIEGQQYAVIARCPYVKGNVDSFDATDALEIQGVTDVRAVPVLTDDENITYPNRAGVAVIATSLWAAMKGREKLQITWDKGPQTHVNNAWLEESADRLFKEGERTVRLEKGDFKHAFETADQTLEHTYTLPYFGHFNMEPMNAAAHYTKAGLLIRMSHQAPSFSAMEVSEYTGLPFEKITIEHGRVGCGFGRKWSWDNVMEAVYLSKETGLPIKVFWTREDDAQNDFLNPHTVFQMKAGYSNSGDITAWGAAFVCQWGSRLKSFPVQVVDNVKIENIRSESLVPVGAWRGPGNNISGFVIESMMTHLARNLEEDPLAFRLRILGDDIKYPSQDWMPGTRREERFLDSARTKAVLKRVAEMASWDTASLPDGWGRGIASHMTFGGYAAFVVDVSMSGGEMTVERVYGAVDCGQVINRLGALAQIESGIHDALSTVLYQEIEITDGSVQTLNFDQAPLVRMAEAPKVIEIDFVDGDDEPWGLGEIALPAAIPAIISAVEDATGKTITRLPLGDQLT